MSDGTGSSDGGGVASIVNFAEMQDARRLLTQSRLVLVATITPDILFPTDY